MIEKVSNSNQAKTIHFEYVGESSHFHTPNEILVSATYHSLPSAAYS